MAGDLLRSSSPASRCAARRSKTWPAGSTKRSRWLDLGSRVRAGERGRGDHGQPGHREHRHRGEGDGGSRARGLGAAPFIVPAMGSHGGGTAEGQTDFLASFGITEDFCGCSIEARMDVVTLADSKLGFPILYAKSAAEADHVVVVSRVKTHTMFTGPIKSGIAKIGDHRAREARRHGALPPGDVRARLDGRDQRRDADRGRAAEFHRRRRTASSGATSRRRASKPSQESASSMWSPSLLADSLRWMATIPFTDIDLLLINKMGKKHRRHCTSTRRSWAARTRCITPIRSGSSACATSPARRANRRDAREHGRRGLRRVLPLACPREMDVAVTRLNTLTAAMFRPRWCQSTSRPTPRSWTPRPRSSGCGRRPKRRGHLDPQHVEVDLIACSEAFLEEESSETTSKWSAA